MADKGRYVIVAACKGGGQQILDLDKQMNYSELTNRICEVYFPGGYNQQQGLNIADCDYFLASYTGTELPHMDGEFTVGRYFEMLARTPVRVYLHTSVS